MIIVTITVMILTGWTLIIVLAMDMIMVNKTGSYDDIIFNIQLNFDTNHQPPNFFSLSLSFYLHSMRGGKKNHGIYSLPPSNSHFPPFECDVMAVGGVIICV